MSERQFEVVTFVGVYDSSQAIDPSAFTPADIDAIETSMDATVSVAQGTSSHGAGFAIAVPTRQLDILLFGNRVEVRSMKPTFAENVASDMAKFLGELSPKTADFPWTRIGFNFILRSDLETPAVAKVKEYFFREDLADLLGEQVEEVTGGAAWVWLTVGEDTLWLRLQPHRDNPSSSRILINANITQDLISPEQFPDPTTIATQLWERWLKVDGVLNGVGI